MRISDLHAFVTIYVLLLLFLPGLVARVQSLTIMEDGLLAVVEAHFLASLIDRLLAVVDAQLLPPPLYVSPSLSAFIRRYWIFIWRTSRVEVY
jgi:hypothetical protein